MTVSYALRCQFGILSSIFIDLISKALSNSLESSLEHVETLS